MADKDIQIQARNDSNTETDNLYPITKVENVQGLSTELSNINDNILTRQENWGATTVHRDRIDANISSRQANWGATTTHRDRINATISSRADQTTANAIKAKTDLIGVANPTANTTTVMGYLRHINDTINNSNLGQVQMFYGRASTTNRTETTLLNISNAKGGILWMLRGEVTRGETTGRMMVIIDGQTVYDAWTNSGSNAHFFVTSVNAIADNGFPIASVPSSGYAENVSIVPIPFMNNIVVRMRNSNNSVSTAILRWFGHLNV